MRTARHRSRWTRIGATLTVASCAACLSPEIFATVGVLVREPVQVARLGAADTTLSLSIDGVPSELVFPAAERLETEPLTLGQGQRIVSLGLSVGQPVVAAGLSDPLVVPAIDAVEDNVHFDVPLILAAPNVVELLDDQVPSPRSRVTVCADRGPFPAEGRPASSRPGRVWFFGGTTPSGARALNGYAFSNQTLTGKTTVMTDLLPGDLACDSDGDGRFVLIEGGCTDGVPTGLARISTGNESRDAVVQLGLSLCSPRVSVAGGNIWIASVGRVDRFNIEDGAVTASGLSMTMDPPLTPRAAMALSADVFLFAEGNNVHVVRVVEGTLQASSTAITAPVDFARAPSGEVSLLTGGGLVLRLDAQGQATAGPLLPLDGMTPQQLEVLPDGRTVVLASEGLVIEGSPRVDTERDGLAVTVGGAVLLVGGDAAGTDVVVPALLNQAGG